MARTKKSELGQWWVFLNREHTNFSICKFEPIGVDLGPFRTYGEAWHAAIDYYREERKALMPVIRAIQGMRRQWE